MHQPGQIRTSRAGQRRRHIGGTVPRAFALLTALTFLISACNTLSTDDPQLNTTATCNTTNLALNKAATASSSENAGYLGAAQAVDGNLNTRWASDRSDPQWLQVDLGNAQTICGVTLEWEAAYGKAFKIQVSNTPSNEASWTTIYQTTTGTGGTQTLTPTVTASGQYVRMLGTQRGTGYGYSLYEFQVFTGSGGTPTPPPTSGAACFYADINFGGASFCANADTAWVGSNWNDRISSVKVQGGYQVQLFEDINYGGASKTFSGDVATVGSDFNDRASSFKVSKTGVSLPTSDTPDFGPNVKIYSDSTLDSDIQADLDAAFNAQLRNPAAQFGDQRNVFLFKPGSYNVFANVGFYTTLAGLGQNPDDVTITRNINVDSGWVYGDEKNATQNFWRSAENLSVAPEGGTMRWAVSQAAPMRRVHVKGNMTMGPSNQDYGQGYSSGGYMADSKVDGQMSSGSQQQWYTRNSALGSWAGGNWNMVFSGVGGAPEADVSHTVLPTTPVSGEKPYLYLDNQGKYRIFVPAVRRGTVGTTWPDTGGTSVPLSQFYVAHPGDSAARINSALTQGLNLFFTPGVYQLDQTLNITRAGTIVYGLGFPTLVPQNGVDAMSVADVSGVRLSGLLFDAGAQNSKNLLTVGKAGIHTDHSSDPTIVQDAYFRVGGPRAGKATNSLVVNSDDTVVDHTWIWRADHGAGVGWTVNTADTGFLVNGNNVLATGLFVEHYQKYEVMWNGEGGKTIFFQNEMPYDPPSLAAWNSPTGDGYASYKVADSVKTHELWGGGAYAYFNVNPSIRASRGFEVPVTPGVKLHNVFTVSLGDVGGITHVVNNTGGAVPNPAGNTVPVYVPSFP